MIKKLITEIKNRTQAKEFLLGTGITFILRSFGLVFSYIFNVVIARWFGAAAVGIYSLAVDWLRIPMTISLWGHDTTLTRRIPKLRVKSKKDKIRFLYSISLRRVIIIGLILTSIQLLGANLIAEIIFKKPELTNLIRITSLGTIPWALTLLNSEALRGFKDIKAYSYIQYFGIPFLNTIILVASYLIFGSGSYIPVITYIATVLIFSITSFVRWKKKIGTISFDKEYSTKDINKLSTTLFLNTLALMIFQVADSIFIGRYASEIDLGVFSVVKKIVMILTITTYATNSIAIPRFTELYQMKNHQKTKNFTQKFYAISFWPTLVILIGTLIFQKPILYLFGSEFVEGTTILYVLVFGYFISAVQGPLGQLIQVTKKPYVTTNINWLISIFNLLANFMIAPAFGVIGVAYVRTISYILKFIITYAYSIRLLGFSVFSIKKFFTFYK